MEFSTGDTSHFEINPKVFEDDIFVIEDNSVTFEFRFQSVCHITGIRDNCRILGGSSLESHRSPTSNFW